MELAGRQRGVRTVRDMYSGNRPELLGFFDASDRTVLDVGCGGGGLGPLLRSAGARRVIGIEPDPDRAATAASGAAYDRVVTTSVEAALATGELAGERFELIVLADCLEHLVDPWTVLARLVDEHLAPGGDVFISVPNVASLPVVKQLVLRRDWRYDDSGLFDATHLRWFGGGSLDRLIEDAGLVQVRLGGIVSLTIKGRLGFSTTRKDVRRIPRILMTQFYVLARHRAGTR